MLPKSLRRTPPLLVAGCVLFFFSAYFPISFPDIPGASVGSFIATFLIAAPSIVALFRWLGTRRAMLAIVALSAFAYAIETTGVVTGLPYGEFSYGDSLGPKAFGLVPYLLPVTYVPLVLGAGGATGGGRPVLWALRSAVVLVLIDGVLDPGAVGLGFWEYAAGGVYYGVPVSNFLGWLLSGALGAGVLLAVGRPYRSAPPGILDSSILAAAFWTGVAVFMGLVFPALLGVVLVIFLYARRAALATKTV